MWKPALAPGEYCCLLAASATETSANADELKRLNEGIIHCGELFEKALYSADALSDAENSMFKSLIEEITSKNYLGRQVSNNNEDIEGKGS
jgi:hypothetical protein